MRSREEDVRSAMEYQQTNDPAGICTSIMTTILEKSAGYFVLTATADSDISKMTLKDLLQQKNIYWSLDGIPDLF